MERSAFPRHSQERRDRPMLTQADKGHSLRALHEPDTAFIIPNPWDIGWARLLAHLGFEAPATTSAGYAFSVGRRENTIHRHVMMAHVSAIASATDLPVSADLENGFGDSPEIVACRQPDHPIYKREYAVERVRVAAEAVRALPFAFTLTARAENYLAGKPDLRDTIMRLQAYRMAGADVLYAPGLTRKDDIAAVVGSVDRPVNVVMGLQSIQLSLAELSAIGVGRVSVGSALSRAALGVFLRAAHEMREHGTLAFAEDAVSYRDIDAMFTA